MPRVYLGAFCFSYIRSQNINIKKKGGTESVPPFFLTNLFMNAVQSAILFPDMKARPDRFEMQ